MLQDGGLVRCLQGKGIFVADEVADKRWLRLETEWSALVSTIEDNVPGFSRAGGPFNFRSLKKEKGTLPTHTNIC